MKTKPGNAVQLIGRVARLFDALAAYDEPVSLKVLSADTELHPSTAHRILAALAIEGLVERDARGRYRLGHKLIQLGCRLRGDATLEQLARPVMDALRDELGETVNLTIREGDDVVYIARSTVPNRIMRVEQVIGSRAPLHVTAVGKLILGEQRPDDCRAYAARTHLARFTPNTIVDADRLIAEVQRDHQQGYAFDNEEAELGVGCIGVLVRDGEGAAVAGLSVSAPMDRRRDDWVSRVVAAGRDISARLGYREPTVAVAEGA